MVHKGWLACNRSCTRKIVIPCTSVTNKILAKVLFPMSSKLIAPLSPTPSVPSNLFIKSASYNYKFLKTEYDSRFNTTPPSTIILVSGGPTARRAGVFAPGLSAWIMVSILVSYHYGQSRASVFYLPWSFFHFRGMCRKGTTQRRKKSCHIGTLWSNGVTAQIWYLKIWAKFSLLLCIASWHTYLNC